MEKEPKKRGRGRPPKFAATTHASFHVGLRLPDERRDQLLALVRLANERAEESGIPPTVTPSSLIRLWIDQRLDQESEKIIEAKGRAWWDRLRGT